MAMRFENTFLQTTPRRAKAPMAVFQLFQGKMASEQLRVHNSSFNRPIAVNLQDPPTAVEKLQEHHLPLGPESTHALQSGCRRLC